MKKVLLLFVIAFAFLSANAQEIDLDKYHQFQESVKDADYSTAKEINKQNTYKKFKNFSYSIDDALYLDSIKAKLKLTDDEMQLLRENSFVVLNRDYYSDFIEALGSYWHKDLPLYINTDMFEFAFHKLYDGALKYLELETLYYKLDTLLSNTIAEIPENASTDEITAYKDMNLYLNVARSLLGSSLNVNYEETESVYIQHLNDIISKCYEYSYDDNFQIFPNTSPRQYDFSQLKPRGHYSNLENLQRYFKAMMWLGRTELYLIPPVSADYTDENTLNRQTAVAYLIAQRINENPKLKEMYLYMNNILTKFIGEQDNVQFENIIELAEELKINSLCDLLMPQKIKAFRDTLKTKQYADQKILSQCLLGTLDTTITPASAFLLFGSRFIFDSYVFSNLVHDKVKDRMMPKPLEVLYVLGNNSAAEFLEADFKYKDYGKNLLSLKYLLDSYGDEFWNSSIYNRWLKTIKTLNPPSNIESLPEYMQTPAWWQMKMNSQLAAWATIRHDNIIYSKQSITGGNLCSYPEVTIEPITEFYEVTDAMVETLSSLYPEGDYIDKIAYKTLNNSMLILSTCLKQLKEISIKINNNSPLLEIEIDFLKNIYDIAPESNWSECGSSEADSSTGWYYKMISHFREQYESIFSDVHTNPTDIEGNIVGEVLHVATGEVNTMVVVVPNAQGVPIAYVSPVYSYYEYITTDFQRLDDEKWQEILMNSINPKPSFTHLYMADYDGKRYDSPESLSYYELSSTEENDKAVLGEMAVSPNPFAQSTNILLKLYNTSNIENISASVYNQAGELVKDLLNTTVTGGNYLLAWDGTSSNGSQCSSGVYFIKISISGKEFTAKLIKE